jgi:hypothetical protein
MKVRGSGLPRSKEFFYGDFDIQFWGFERQEVFKVKRFLVGRQTPEALYILPEGGVQRHM